MMKVLIIESDARQAQRLRQAFEEWGLAVEVATTGAAALERRLDRFAALTLEPLVPLVNGRTLLTTLARSEAPPPVFVVSESADRGLREELLAFPFVRHWFQKPVDLDLLRAGVEAALGTQRAAHRGELVRGGAVVAPAVTKATAPTAPLADSAERDSAGTLQAPGEMIEGTDNPYARLTPAHRRSRDLAPMMRIAGGATVIGTTQGEGPEAPPVAVTLSPYYLDVYPVTNARYTRFLTWSAAAREPHAHCHPDEPAAKSHEPLAWRDRAFSGPEQPVVGVDWWDAFAYARWACETTEHVCLPTEVQWEFAARGGVEQRVGDDPGAALYPWGFGAPDAERANFGGRQPHTTPVDAYPRGVAPFGIFDLLGNVWEWCADYFDAAFYAKLARGDGPARDPVAWAESFARSLRGGSFQTPGRELRATTRGSQRPGTREYTIGFRVAAPAALVDTL